MAAAAESWHGLGIEQSLGIDLPTNLPQLGAHCSCMSRLTSTTLMVAGPVGDFLRASRPVQVAGRKADARGGPAAVALAQPRHSPWPLPPAPPEPPMRPRCVARRPSPSAPSSRHDARSVACCVQRCPSACLPSLHIVTSSGNFPEFLAICSPDAQIELWPEKPKACVPS